RARSRDRARRRGRGRDSPPGAGCAGFPGSRRGAWRRGDGRWSAVLADRSHLWNAVTVAVVGDPSTGELHVAERGRGAWLAKDDAWNPLTPSDGSLTIVVEDGKAKGRRREPAARFTAAAIRADRWDFRSLGTTLALPYVAAGRISAYVVFWISAIHAGPGREIRHDAARFDGRPWAIRSDSLVAT